MTHRSLTPNVTCPIDLKTYGLSGRNGLTVQVQVGTTTSEPKRMIFQPLSLRCEEQPSCVMYALCSNPALDML